MPTKGLPHDFKSYNQEMAQEGWRQLELIVNNQHSPEQPNHRALRNDMTTSGKRNRH